MRNPIAQLVEDLAAGRISPEQGLAALRDLPNEPLGYARLDHHRILRSGLPEVVFGAGKTDEQVLAIMGSLAGRGQNVLVTRTTAEVHRRVAERFPAARFHDPARCITLTAAPADPLPGRVAVLCAGTSDIPVAEEAAVTVEFYAAAVDRYYDVGVAGLHRLLDKTTSVREADVVVVAAGMEGALPSVVGGLVDAPVIAVPTSIGYGASFHGLAALLAMLNTCASGVAVVNIDNGFGAGYMASVILRGLSRGTRARPDR